MKRRAPETFEAALYRAMGVLGIETLEKATGRSASLIRRWADPDDDKNIQHQHSVAIDAACASRD